VINQTRQNNHIMEYVGSADDLFYALFQNSPVGILLFDETIHLIDANQLVFKYFFQEEEPVRGKLFGNLFHCAAATSGQGECGTLPNCQTCQVRRFLTGTINTGQLFTGMEIEHAFDMNGRRDTKWFSVSVTPVRHQTLHYAVMSMVDITLLKRREEALVQLGITDELTGLFNRRFIMEKFRQLLIQAQKKQTAMTVAMLDLDHFKIINDEFGHLAGDSVLKVLSHLMRTGIRYSDFAGRYGGEEFLLLIPDSDEIIGRNIIERIRQRFLKSQIDLVPQVVSFSAGLVEIPPAVLAHINPQSVISQADALLYQAKDRGRNRIESGCFK
jgi:diguanylate cyclase (GGDEF)-like protein